MKSIWMSKLKWRSQSYRSGKQWQEKIAKITNFPHEMHKNIEIIEFNKDQFDDFHNRFESMMPFLYQ